MGRTFFDKIWDDHVIAALGNDTYLLQVDRLVLHELSGAAPMRKLKSSGRAPDSPAQVFATIDHMVSTRPGRSIDEVGPRGGAEMIQDTRQLAGEYGFVFFDTDDPRQGIVHVVSPEQGIALPGTTLVCGDSHTCTVGGLGALAWGIGTSEVEHVLATQTITQTKPKTMLIRFDGALGAGVTPKDMIMHLIGMIGIDGGIGYAAEFGGSLIRAMPIEGRLTICNMAVEFQAKYGFVAPDEITLRYGEGRPFAPKGEAWTRASADWLALASDADAAYDREIAVDCGTLAPQVTWGINPGQVLPIDARVPDPRALADGAERQLVERALDYMALAAEAPIRGTPIDVAYIGSCTNARLSDLREAARLLTGNRIAGGVQAICVPGSTAVKAAAEAEGLDQIFKDAGFEWHESGCAMCSAGGGHILGGRRVISTTNRNFEGRQGPKTKTHLASPVTVAASALAGVIADPRDI
jgi:3-isopropylmalate/(R)-2-methylmalate dehydratase large subunit